MKSLLNQNVIKINLIAFVAISYCAKGQNLYNYIDNPGFEDIPNTTWDFEYAAGINGPANNNQLLDIGFPPSQGGLIQVDISPVPTCSLGTQYPHMGSSYASVMSYHVGDPPASLGSVHRGDLKCHLKQGLTDGKHYVFECWVSRMDNYAFLIDRVPDLRVFLASGTNGNNKVEILDKEVTDDGKPGDVIWYHYIEEFQLKTYNNTKDWLFLRCNNQTLFGYAGNFLTGFYVDDVGLYDACDYYTQQSCRVTSGNVYISANHTYHMEDDQFQINAMANANSVDIEVHDLGGNLVRTMHEERTNGLKAPIVWNGRTNGGGECSQGMYEFHVTAHNACGSFTATISCFKVNGVADPTDPPYPWYQYLPDQDFPLYIPCCKENIVIQNCTIDIPLATFWAQNTITIGPNVTFANNTYSSFFAGSAINFVNPIYQLGNAEIDEFIFPCPLRPMNTDEGDNFVLAESELIQNQYPDHSNIDLKQNEVLSVFPNPVRNNLTIVSYPKRLKTITIYHVQGVELKRIECQFKNDFKIDFSNFSNGIYFLKMRFDDDSEKIQKVVHFN